MRLTLLLFGLISVSALAVEPSPVDEMSARSALPANEINALLADCNASQTSMNFCAWRDQITVERALRQVIDQQELMTPNRKAGLEQKLAAWKVSRDRTCQESAKKEWDGGSMQVAAQAMCITAETKRMIKKINLEK